MQMYKFTERGNFKCNFDVKNKDFTPRKENFNEKLKFYSEGEKLITRF